MEIGESNAAAQLYLSVDLVKEAIDCLVAVEEWTKARKLAKELGPSFESYVESKYKDRLLKEGNVEQLADIGSKRNSTHIIDSRFNIFFLQILWELWIF